MQVAAHQHVGDGAANELADLQLALGGAAAFAVPGAVHDSLLRKEGRVITPTGGRRND